MQWLVRWLHKLWQHPLIVLVIGTMLVWGLENYYADLLKTHGTRSLITLALAVVSAVVISWVARRLWQRFGPQRRILVGFPPGRASWFDCALWQTRDTHEGDHAASASSRISLSGGDR